MNALLTSFVHLFYPVTAHALVRKSYFVRKLVLGRACVLRRVQDCSPRDPRVHGIPQASTLQWAAASSARRSDPGIEPASPEPPAPHCATSGAHAARCIDCVCFLPAPCSSSLSILLFGHLLLIDLYVTLLRKLILRRISHKNFFSVIFLY